MDRTMMVVDMILEMDYEALMKVFDVATFRWGELFPDWQITTISLPRNDPEYKKQLVESILKMNAHENQPSRCIWPDELLSKHE